jgi:hypothetical protein
MKYKVKGTNIKHNGKLYKEGSEIELSKTDAERLKGYIEEVKKEEVNKEGGKK